MEGIGKCARITFSKCGWCLSGRCDHVLLDSRALAHVRAIRGIENALEFGSLGSTISMKERRCSRWLLVSILDEPGVLYPLYDVANCYHGYFCQPQSSDHLLTISQSISRLQKAVGMYCCNSIFVPHKLIELDRGAESSEVRKEGISLLLRHVRYCKKNNCIIGRQKVRAQNHI